MNTNELLGVQTLIGDKTKNKNLMPKIAVVKADTWYFEDGDYTVIKSISEWTDVSSQDLEILKKYIGSEYRILEQVPEFSPDNEMSIERLLNIAKGKQSERQKREKEQAKKAKQRKEKRAAQELERKQKLLEKLKAELGSL